jgi:hypothetical protein
LEVTYVTLLAATKDKNFFNCDQKDLEYLYTAALFHDFDPQKSVDKPHEDNVIQFISLDKDLQKMLNDTGLDIDIITVLILRTTYPWKGQLKEDAEKKIKECFKRSNITKNDEQKQEHFMRLGWFLSIIDRVSGYALGDFSKDLEIAKKNAHALTWHPSLITQRSVSYFEDLLNNESNMCQNVLCLLPNEMRKNFMNAVISFMRMREKELKIQSECIFENLKLVTSVDDTKVRNNGDFIRKIFSIYEELPKPLQFTRIGFTDSIKDDRTILVTIRSGNENAVRDYTFLNSVEKDLHELTPHLMAPISDAKDFVHAMTQYISIHTKIAFLQKNNKISLSMALFFKESFSMALTYIKWTHDIVSLDSTISKLLDTDTRKTLEKFCKENDIAPMPQNLIPLTKNEFIIKYANLIQKEKS